MNKKKFDFQKIRNVKQRGDALLLSLFFSALVIVLAVSLSRFLIQDLFIFRDTFFSEKSYYLAESGVEKALLELKNNPSNTIQESVSIGSGEIAIDAQNVVEKTVFISQPKTTRRIKLVQDLDPSFGVDLESVQVFGVETNPVESKKTGLLSWRVICQKILSVSQKGAVSLSGQIGSSISISDFTVNQKGRLDDLILLGGVVKNPSIQEGKTLKDLWALLKTKEEQQSCYMNIQNISNAEVQVAITQKKGLSPETIRVQSIGEIGGKKKIISFLYQAKNIGSFFDFGFLHTE